MLAEQNADVRRDPASLTKMMTSYVIGQEPKPVNLKTKKLFSHYRQRRRGPPVTRRLRFFADVPQTWACRFRFSAIRGIDLQSGNDACVAMADFAAGSQDALLA
ncbi:hypothetical protein ACLK19_04315 [Escherichia coli]